jgi:predicted phage baseplate assembly protein
MALPTPTIDDRSFEDIVAEARTLIPRYAPEWTDHNESDPGITLVQLFAFLTDILIFRLNRVPELNHVKFLELVGLRLRPAEPAKGELTFTLVPGARGVIVPKGTQVAGAAADGAPVIFETDEALVTFPGTLAAVQVFDGAAYAPITVSAAAGTPYEPFGRNHRDGSALLLGLQVDGPFPTGIVDLGVHVSTEGLRPEGEHCDLDLTRLAPPATVVWEAWDRERREWFGIVVDSDETRALTRSGHVRLRGPGSRLLPDRLGEVEEQRHWLRLRLARGAYELTPRLDAVLLNSVRATAAVTIRHEVLGGSDGRQNQAVRLSLAPVVARAGGEPPVALEIDEGSGFAPWREVPDFYGSGPADPHYALDRASGEIRFGDGRHGRIPVANLLNRDANVVAREYRAGGGARGNVAAATVTELQTSIEGVDSVVNLRATEGGSEQETLADAKLRTSRELRHRERAVTPSDFEDLARDTPGARVRRAHALALVDPRFPDARVPGAVTVVVVPEGDTPAPMPSPSTLRAVCAHLDAHRLLTTELHVVAPTYIEVSVLADVVAQGDADLAVVKRLIEERLDRWFHPLVGGADGSGWEFGRDISYSQVYRQVLDVPGVDRIRDSGLFLVVAGDRQPFCRDVAVAPGALLFTAGHRIDVAYGDER